MLLKLVPIPSVTHVKYSREFKMTELHTTFKLTSAKLVTWYEQLTVCMHIKKFLHVIFGPPHLNIFTAKFLNPTPVRLRRLINECLTQSHHCCDFLLMALMQSAGQ